MYKNQACFNHGIYTLNKPALIDQSSRYKRQRHFPTQISHRGTRMKNLNNHKILTIRITTNMVDSNISFDFFFLNMYICIYIYSPLLLQWSPISMCCYVSSECCPNHSVVRPICLTVRKKTGKICLSTTNTFFIMNNIKVSCFSSS